MCEHRRVIAGYLRRLSRKAEQYIPETADERQARIEHEWKVHLLPGGLQDHSAPSVAEKTERA